MFAAELEEQIRRAYESGGYRLGWRLLASPIRVLEHGDVAFIGLNPGGRYQPSDHAVMAPLTGSAYVEERWAGFEAGRSPLQRQVQMLFGAINAVPEEVLAGNLVPFRSASWQSLPNRDEALRFGKSIWVEILQRVKPSLIIAMSQPVYRALNKMLSAGKSHRLESGWGNIGIFYSLSSNQRIVGLPHLSRFPLVGREKSEAALAQAFGPHWRDGDAFGQVRDSEYR